MYIVNISLRRGEWDRRGECKNLCEGKWSYSTIKNRGRFLPEHRRRKKRVLNRRTVLKEPLVSQFKHSQRAVLPDQFTYCTWLNDRTQDFQCERMLSNDSPSQAILIEAFRNMIFSFKNLDFDSILKYPLDIGSSQLAFIGQIYFIRKPRLFDCF